MMLVVLALVYRGSILYGKIISVFVDNPRLNGTIPVRLRHRCADLLLAGGAAGRSGKLDPRPSCVADRPATAPRRGFWRRSRICSGCAATAPGKIPIPRLARSSNRSPRPDRRSARHHALHHQPADFSLAFLERFADDHHGSRRRRHDPLTGPEGETSRASVFQKLMTGLEAQLGGMGTAFSSSLLGLAGSLVVGLLELSQATARTVSTASLKTG